MIVRLPAPCTPSAVPQAGFTLVEVLVALVVLAVGMLGIGILLVGALQSSRMALQRSTAVMLAADLGDRIRANRAGGAAYALTDDSVLPAPPNACTAATPCSAVQLAAVELYDWQQAVLPALPDARTTVSETFDPAAVARVHAIEISWAQSAGGERARISLMVQT